MCLACKSGLQAARECIDDQVVKRLSSLPACDGDRGHALPCARSLLGSVSTGELAIDHCRTQLPFGQIIGGLDRIVPEECEEVILLLEQPHPDGFLIGVSPGLAQQSPGPLLQAQATFATGPGVNLLLGGFEDHCAFEHQSHLVEEALSVSGMGVTGF